MVPRDSLSRSASLPLDATLTKLSSNEEGSTLIPLTKALGPLDTESLFCLSLDLMVTSLLQTDKKTQMKALSVSSRPTLHVFCKRESSPLANELEGWEGCLFSVQTLLPQPEKHSWLLLAPAQDR